MGRLIWYHVPLRLTPGPDARTPHELGKVMTEKRMALDLVEAFAVALKHHLRGEVGIYYEDLYDLVRPLHDFADPSNPHPTVASAVPAPLPLPSSALTPDCGLCLRPSRRPRPRARARPRARRRVQAPTRPSNPPPAARTRRSGPPRPAPLPST